LKTLFEGSTMSLRALVGGLAAVIILGTGISFGCSACACGDKAFIVNGLDSAFASRSEGARLHLLLQNFMSNKSNALSPDEGVGTEAERDMRPTLRADYRLSNQFGLSGELPYVFKRIETTASGQRSSETASGLGDALLSAAWTRQLGSHNGSGYRLGLAAMLKLPTGQNGLAKNGRRLDEHLQAGTGSYDWQIGALAARPLGTTPVFTSFYFRRPGTNQFGYHYGNAFLYNLGSSLRLARQLTSSLQINGRYARRDSQDGAQVDNTGGWVTYVTPGLRLTVAGSMAVSLSVQVPVQQNLYGVQSEKSVVILGFDLN
jgi:hypothetical protein